MNTPSGTTCDNCGQAHSGNDIFCANCGYDFIVGSLPGPAEGFQSPPVNAAPASAQPGAQLSAHLDAPAVAPPQVVEMPPTAESSPPAMNPPIFSEPQGGPNMSVLSVPPQQPAAAPGEPQPVPGVIYNQAPPTNMPPPAQASQGGGGLFQSPPPGPPGGNQAPGLFDTPGGAPPSPAQAPPPPGGGGVFDLGPGAAPAPNPQMAAPPAPQPAPMGGPKFQLVVSVDRLYFDAVVSEGELEFPNPPPADQYLDVNRAELNMGRNSPNRAIFPELDIGELTGDPAVSSRHAVIRISPDGQVTVTDLGSTNGTFIGSVESDSIAVDQPFILNPGMPVYLGAWTRIIVNQVQ